jgi:hypothetical protein
VCSLSGPARCGSRRRRRAATRDRRRLTDKRRWNCRRRWRRCCRRDASRDRRLAARRRDVRAKPDRREKAAVGSEKPANTQSTWNGRSGHRKPPLITLSPRGPSRYATHTKRVVARERHPPAALEMHAFAYDTRCWRGLELKFLKQWGADMIVLGRFRGAFAAIACLNSKSFGGRMKLWRDSNAYAFGRTCHSLPACFFMVKPQNPRPMDFRPREH